MGASRLYHRNGLLRARHRGIMKIALVIGHNARQPGAIRATDGVSEYAWNGRLADAIAAIDPARYAIVRRTHGAGEISRAYAEVNRLGVEASVELHFNGSNSAAATGTETLTSGTRNSVRLATSMQHHIVNALGLRDRGLKVIGRNGRGGASLWSGVPPAVLLEPYFGSNAGDCAIADNRFDALATAIHTACTAFLSGK